MHLRSCLLPIQSDNRPLDNRVPPMANSNQTSDDEGSHCEMHNIIEQIRVMNRLNANLVQHLTQALAPLPYQS